MALLRAGAAGGRRGAPRARAPGAAALHHRRGARQHPRAQRCLVVQHAARALVPGRGGGRTARWWTAGGAGRSCAWAAPPRSTRWRWRPSRCWRAARRWGSRACVGTRSRPTWCGCGVLTVSLLGEEGRRYRWGRCWASRRSCRPVATWWSRARGHRLRRGRLLLDARAADVVEVGGGGVAGGSRLAAPAERRGRSLRRSIRCRMDTHGARRSGEARRRSRPGSGLSRRGLISRGSPRRYRRPVMARVALGALLLTMLAASCSCDPECKADERLEEDKCVLQRAPVLPLGAEHGDHDVYAAAALLPRWPRGGLQRRRSERAHYLLPRRGPSATTGECASSCVAGESLGCASTDARALCAADGFTRSSSTCPASAPRCLGGACVPLPGCTPGVTTCVNDELSTCLADGQTVRTSTCALGCAGGQCRLPCRDADDDQVGLRVRGGEARQHRPYAPVRDHGVQRHARACAGPRRAGRGHGDGAPLGPAGVSASHRATHRVDHRGLQPQPRERACGERYADHRASVQPHQQRRRLQQRRVAPPARERGRHGVPGRELACTGRHRVLAGAPRRLVCHGGRDASGHDGGRRDTGQRHPCRRWACPRCPAGVTERFTLRQGEVLSFGSEDVTGTRVVSDQPIAGVRRKQLRHGARELAVLRPHGGAAPAGAAVGP
jgi:hypothetical protein